MRYRLVSIIGVLLLAGLALMPVAARAQQSGSMRSGASAIVGKDEVIDSSVYLAGETVTVAGTVHGDVFCAGQNVEIAGVIDGDVFCAGQTVRVSGTVAGGVRIAGQSVTLDGPVARSASIFGQSVELTERSSVNIDATVFASVIRMNGHIGRDITMGGQTVTVTGSVARNVTNYGEHLALQNGSRVGGRLDYTSNNSATIGSAVHVAGQTQRHDPPKHEEAVSNTWVDRFQGATYWFGALGLCGLVLLGLVPQSFAGAKRVMTKRGWQALLVGSVTLLMLPFVALILILTFVGLPLGFALLFTWAGMMLASYVYSGYLVGSFVIDQMGWHVRWERFAGLLIGLGLFTLLWMIPIIGGLMGFVALIWGMGGLTLLLGEHYKVRNHEAGSRSSKA